MKLRRAAPPTVVGRIGGQSTPTAAEAKAVTPRAGCRGKGCHARARWQVCLVHRPSVGIEILAGRHFRVPAKTTIGVCDACKGKLTLADVQTKTYRETVRAAFNEAMTWEPDFTRTELRFEAIA